MQSSWMLITILIMLMLMDNADYVDGRARMTKEELAEVKKFHTSDILAKLLNLKRLTGEIVVCCRRFSYIIHGRIHTVGLIVYDGLIINEETGDQFLIKHYPDETSTMNELVPAMIRYMTSLGEMDVKPCLLNYTYPLTSPDDKCASHRSLSCDQQCIFQCGEGYISTTEPITCCDKGLLSTSLSTCHDKPRATTPEHGETTRSKASSVSTPADTMNTPTDKAGTDIPENNSRRNRKFLAFISSPILIILIPLIYWARRKLKRNVIKYSRLGDNSCPLTSEGIDVEPDGRGSYKKWSVPPAKPSPTQLDSNENYRMNVRDKGLIYILNNNTFILPDDEKLERKGSEIDVENVKHVFEQIGYKPVIHENLTAQEIRASWKSFKGQLESSHPSVVLMFMSHGDEKGILGVDLCHITVREIKNAFSGQKCKVLIGKPKIIFVQACRGDNIMKNVIESDWLPMLPRTDTNLTKPRSILESDGPEAQSMELTTRHIEPDSTEADAAHYYIAQSTTEGYFSLRSRVEGSCFIQALCEELIKKAHEETLDTIMGLVTRRVQGREWRFNGLKTLQVPQIIKQGFEKDIYFLPKYPN